VEVLRDTGFGSVSVLAPTTAPKGLALLLTGSAGLDTPLRELAEVIAAQDYVVAIIDSNTAIVRKMATMSVAKDLISEFTALGAMLDTRYHVAGKRPVIVGYGSGGALVYRVLVQAAPGVFHAGISLDFCPAIATNPGAAPLPSTTHLDTVWFVFQRAPACDADVAARFVHTVDNARLENIGEHAANTRAPWQLLTSVLQWLDPRLEDQLQADESITGVPLIEIPAERYRPGGRMAVLLSGDGGWAELDRSVAATLADLGVAVVGWDSQSYFWRAKTPGQAGRDLDRVLRHYRAAWRPGSISLIGYSFGADVLPFMASRLSAEVRALIDRIVLISPGPKASFEFHLSDWLEGPHENTVPLLPEFGRLHWTKVVCVYGDEEKSSACPSFAEQGVSLLSLEGDHHFNGEYRNLALRLIHD